MKTLLNRKLVIYFILLLTHAYSQDHWNPSLTETQKVAAMIELERVKAEALKPSPVHAVLSLSGEQCSIGISGNTNAVVYRPLHSQAFNARLFTADGKEISKKWFDYEFGQTLKPDKELLDGSFAMSEEAKFGNSRMLRFPRDSSGHYWDFDVLKNFQIKEAGEYRLQVQVRLFTKDTNGVFQPFILPPVETKVNISENDLER